MHTACLFVYALCLQNIICPSYDLPQKELHRPGCICSKEYSTFLGSSSTGQWTMVAFYVCFRATVKETVNAAISREIGHGIGAIQRRPYGIPLGY